MKRYALLLLCLLALPTAAEGRPVEPGTTEVRATTVAVNYWAARGATQLAPRCNGSVAWNVEGLAVQSNGSQIAGYLISDDSGCRITLTNMAPRMLCTSAVHEYGHALGFEHTSRGIMSGYQTEPVRECKRAFSRKKGKRIKGRKAQAIRPV